MKTKLTSLVLVLSWPACRTGRITLPKELTRRTIRRRAVEAVIWGMPAIKEPWFEKTWRPGEIELVK